MTCPNGIRLEFDARDTAQAEFALRLAAVTQQQPAAASHATSAQSSIAAASDAQIAFAGLPALDLPTSASPPLSSTAPPAVAAASEDVVMHEVTPSSVPAACSSHAVKEEPAQRSLAHKRPRSQRSAASSSTQAQDEIELRPAKHRKSAQQLQTDRLAEWSAVAAAASSMEESKKDLDEGSAVTSPPAAAAAAASHAAIKEEVEDVEQYRTSKASRVPTATILYDANPLLTVARLLSSVPFSARRSGSCPTSGLCSRGNATARTVIQPG
jgi:hypothetical protein